MHFLKHTITKCFTYKIKYTHMNMTKIIKTKGEQRNYKKANL